MLFNRKPKVACPKCKTLHELNSESTCPVCGTKYKLPDEFSAALSKSSSFSLKAFSDKAVSIISSKADKLLQHFGNLKSSTRRLIKISSLLLVFFVLFIAVVLACFSDKEPLLYKPGTPENQPVFYYTDDDRLCCFFPNGKNVEIGIGILREYSSDNNGKNVYLTFSGELSSNHGTSKNEASNYLLSVENFEKIRYIYDNPNSVPQILCGGNNEYLYVLNNLGGEADFREFALIRRNGKSLNIAQDVKEVTISPNGHYALFSIDDNGASKLLTYNAKTGETKNPGIKNATPLSIDNKGEYLVYAKKTDAESLSIVSEKSTSERLEIATIKEAALSRIIFSADKRSLAIEYNDRTTFYTCGDTYYSTVLTYNGSRFGMSIAYNARQNILSLSDIPEVDISDKASLLPYYFYDKERESIYCVDKDGAKLPVFDRTFTELVVSESGNVAFVSQGKLFSGRLSPRDNRLCELSDFSEKTLVDISPDGSKILYSDTDGNLFSTSHGVKNDTPEKLYVDADFVNFSSDGKILLVCGDNVTSFISGSRVTNLCEGIIPEETSIIKGNLSEIIYARETYIGGEPTGKKSLCLYSGGKTKIISENLGRLVVNDSVRVDRTLSDYVDIYAANPAK